MPALRELLNRTLEGFIALKAGRYQVAVDQLAAVTPDQKNPLSINALFVRAQASSALSRWEDAERDYQAILALRPARTYNLAEPMSYIGLARGYAARGNVAAAREQYAKFHALWKQADADLPIVRAVQAEEAKLPAAGS